MTTTAKHTLAQRVAALGVLGGFLTQEAAATIADEKDELLTQVLDGICVGHFMAHPAQLDAILNENNAANS